MSPARILFHRDLKDGIPTDPKNLKPHRKWIDTAMRREEAFCGRNRGLMNRFNRSAHSHKPIDIGSTVLIQDTAGISRKRWIKSGTVVDRLDRKYWIRMHGSGRIVSRNRIHVKTTDLPCDSDHLPYIPPLSVDVENNSSNNLPSHEMETQQPDSDIQLPPQDTNAPPILSKEPGMLRKLRPFNKPKRLEE